MDIELHAEDGTVLKAGAYFATEEELPPVFYVKGKGRRTTKHRYFLKDKGIVFKEIFPQLTTPFTDPSTP